MPESLLTSKFMGAADLVLGLERGSQQNQLNALRIQVASDARDFDRLTEPLRLQLLQEQVAGQQLDVLTRGFTLHRLSERAADEARLRATATEALNVFGREFSEYSTGRITGHDPALGTAGAAGLPPLPTDSVDGAVSDLIPFGPDDADAAPSVRSVPGELTVEELTAKLPDPLKPLASEFVAAGHRYGIDPRFLAAISRFETGNGTSKAFREKGNAMGASGSNGPYDFGAGNAEDSIDYMARRLADPKRPYAKARSIAEFGAVYSPPGAGNDPRGTNHLWPSSVGRFYRELGGNASLAATNAVSEPQAILLHRRLSDIVSSFGGADGFLKAHPEWGSQVVEWGRRLATDPDVLAEEARVAALAQVQAAIGAIRSAGEDPADYGDVLDHVARGGSFEPKLFSERLNAAAQRRFREPPEEKPPSATERLASFTQQPATQAFAQAGAVLASSMSGEASSSFQGLVADSLARGDFETARQIVFKGTDDAVKGPRATHLADYKRLGALMDTMREALDKFYKTGKGTSLTEGTVEAVVQKLRKSTDLDLLELGTSLTTVFQQYRSVLSGAAFSAQESEDYLRLFPIITKLKENNMRAVDTLKNVFSGQVVAIRREVLGPLYDRLYGAPGAAAAAGFGAVPGTVSTAGTAPSPQDLAQRLSLFSPESQQVALDIITAAKTGKISREEAQRRLRAEVPELGGQ